MARISYVDPVDVEDDEARGWLELAIEKGKPGPENQAIRAHQPDVMRSFTKTREWLFHHGVLDHDLKELVRVRIATSLDCHY